MTNNLLLAFVHLFHLFPCSSSFLLVLGSTLSENILPPYIGTFRGIKDRRNETDVRHSGCFGV